MAATSNNQAPRSAANRFDSLAQEAYLNIWRTYDRLKAVEDELFGGRDLSAQQYNALRLLQVAHPGSMQTSALGAKLISRAPDMTRLLDRLEDQGLVWRERRRENRRVVEVGITSEGLRMLDEIASAVEACHERQLGHLSDKQLLELISLLSLAREPHENADSLWAPKREKA